MTAELWIAVGLWVVSIAGLAGQNWANTSSLKQRQDDTNEHLRLLNGKTFDSHREIGSLIGKLESLPCQTGKMAIGDCPAVPKGSE